MQAILKPGKLHFLNPLLPPSRCRLTTAHLGFHSGPSVAPYLGHASPPIILRSLPPLGFAERHTCPTPLGSLYRHLPTWDNTWAQQPCPSGPQPPAGAHDGHSKLPAVVPPQSKLERAKTRGNLVAESSGVPLDPPAGNADRWPPIQKCFHGGHKGGALSEVAHVGKHGDIISEVEPPQRWEGSA